LISRITDKIMPDIAEWQSRPLSEIYPVVFFDGIYFKVKKDGKVINKCVYSVLGIDTEGKKDILGIWISETESASFWTTVFNELRNRGVKDILIACHDNLPGFANALATVFPKTENQLCIIYMIRNSTKYVSYKDLKALMANLKEIYSAVSEEAALYALEEFAEKWNSKYPQIYKMWETNWRDIAGFFKYPPEMRRLIYTTNAVEGFHRMLRKFTKTKTNYPTDDSLKKSIYLSVREISKKWNQPVQNWGIIIGQFLMFYEDRFKDVRIA
jgi:putative transposase